MSIQNSVNQFLTLGAFVADIEEKKSAEKTKGAIRSQNIQKNLADKELRNESLVEEAGMVGPLAVEPPGNIIGNKQAKKWADENARKFSELRDTQRGLNAEMENDPTLERVSARPQTRQARPRTVTPEQANQMMVEKGQTMVRQKQGYEKIRDLFASKWKEV